jgi:mRNA interferase RelE/StbE
MAEVKITAWCKEKHVPHLPKNILAGFINKLETIAADPECGKPLWGELKRYRSLPLGRYRIVYRYVKDTDIAWIIGIGIRKEGSKEDIYNQITKLLRSGKIRLG